MATADTARLIASLELQDKFSATAAKYDRAIGGMERKTSTLGKIGGEVSRGAQTAVRNIATIGVVAAGAIASQVALGVQGLARIEDINKQTEARIEATGAAANVTKDQVIAMAGALEDLSTVEAESIQEGQNMLLTFKGIRNEVGEGNDIFTQATEAMLDMSVAMGQDSTQTALQLGKALNDPIRGVTALRRVGVQFTEQQMDQIKAMVEAGDVMGAQKIILAELNEEFGGSAEAFGEGPGAAMRRFGHAVGETQEALATGFLPLIEKVSEKVQTFLSDPAVIQQIKDFGVGAAGTLDSLIDTAVALPWGAIGDTFRLIGTGAKAALDFFTGMPSWVQTAVLTGWGLNKLTGGALGNIVGELGKGLIRGVLGMNAGVVNINAATVNGAAGVPAAAGGGGKGILGTLGAVTIVGAGLALLTAIATDINKTANPTGFNFNELAGQKGVSRVQVEGDLLDLSAETGRSIESLQAQMIPLLQQGDMKWQQIVDAVSAGTDAAYSIDRNMLQTVERIAALNSTAQQAKAAASFDAVNLARATSGLGSRIDRVANTPHNVDVDTHVTVNTTVGVSVLQQQAYREHTVYNRDSVSTNTGGY
jgi:hypothetical protein